MTLIVTRKDGYDKEKEKKDLNNEKYAAITLMNILSKKRGEQSNNEEVWNQIDDDKNCEAVTKQTNNSINYDRICVVEANTGEKEGVDINNEGGKKVENEFDIDSLYNHEYDYADIDGTVNGTDNGMIASEHVCIEKIK